MNPKLKKLIEDVAKVNAEAARYIELEAPKLKSYKIWEVLRLSNLFDWAESPQRNGYWFDIDEKIIMLAKGQPADKYSTDHKEGGNEPAASSARVPFSEAAVVCGGCGYTAKIEMFAILKGRDIKGQRVCPGCGRHNSIV